MKIFKIIFSSFCWLLAVNCLIVRDNIHSTSLAEVNETNRYSTTRILDFWKKHEKDFEIGPQKDIILLLGNSGAGITTMSQLLTDADLESISLHDNSNYHSIIDKNGRIDQNFASRTFVPEIIVDPKSGAAFYDGPGFGRSFRRMEYGVAFAHFLNKLTNFANSIKLVIVIRHESITPGNHMYELLKDIERIFYMIGDFEKFSDGIAMIANHAHNTDWKENGTEISLNDAMLTNDVVHFLTNVKNDLEEMIDGENYTRFSRHFLRQAAKFIGMLLVKRNDKYERIGIFRKAPIQGPVNDIEVLRNEKNRLKEIIHKNINYIPKGDTEYGYLLSYNMRNDIQKLVEKIIKEELLADVTNICNEIKHFYLLKEREITDIYLLKTNLKTAYQKLLVIEANETTVFVKLIIDAANVLEINLPNETLDKISKRIENIDFLTKVSAFPSETSIELMIKLRDTTIQLRDSHKWYEFLIYLKIELSRNYSHTDVTKAAAIELQKNCLIGEFEMRNVSDIGLERFLIYANVGRYDYVKELRVNSFELKALHSVLNVLWQ